ncbi:hypothetical protein U1Q18_001888, partial [Sarracenia purpurea var. burkii]
RRGKLYVVPVLGGAAVIAGGVGGDQKTGPEVFDALRRPAVLLRSSHQWLRSSCLDAHPRSHFARFRYRFRQSGTPHFARFRYRDYTKDLHLGLIVNV